MLETAGRELIRMMGHSGTVPGALGADAVSSALQRLEKAVAVDPGRPLSTERERDRDDGEHSGNGDAPVSAATRALPLIEMLRQAAEAGDYIFWE